MQTFIVEPDLGDHLILFLCVCVHARVCMSLAKSIWSCIKLSWFRRYQQQPKGFSCKSVKLPTTASQHSFVSSYRVIQTALKISQSCPCLLSFLMLWPPPCRLRRDTHGSITGTLLLPWWLASGKQRSFQTGTGNKLAWGSPLRHHH